MHAHTQGKKFPSTRRNSGSRTEGSSAAAAGRSMTWAKNMPPTQMTAARIWNNSAIAMTGSLILGLELRYDPRARLRRHGVDRGPHRAQAPTQGIDLVEEPQHQRDSLLVKRHVLIYF